MRRSCSGLVSASALAAANEVVFQAERALTRPDGLPRRPWFRHQIYAPGFYTGYGVKTMPQIREGLEERRPDEAREGVRKVADALGALARRVDEVAALLAKALP